MNTTHLTSAARTDYSTTIDEHRRLIPLLCDLEEWLDTPLDAPEGNSQTWCSGLRTRLSLIYARLLPHFRMEENGPLFKEIPFLYPRFARPLERLLGEHETFGREAELILNSVQEEEVCSRARQVEIGVRAKLLIASLRRHESEENEILQRVYCEDIGTCD